MYWHLADDAVSRPTSVFSCRDRFIVLLVDVSPWEAHRRTIGRYIASALINCASTRHYRLRLLIFIIGPGSASTNLWLINSHPHMNTTKKSKSSGILPLITLWIPEWPLQTNPCKNLDHRYTQEVYVQLCTDVFQHVYESYFGQGKSVYAMAS